MGISTATHLQPVKLNGVFHCRAAAELDKDIFLLYSPLPLLCPSGHLTFVAISVLNDKSNHHGLLPLSQVVHMTNGYPLLPLQIWSIHTNNSAWVSSLRRLIYATREPEVNWCAITYMLIAGIHSGIKPECQDSWSSKCTLKQILAFIVPTE